VQMGVLFVRGQYNVWELTPVIESDSASKHETGVCSSLAPCSL
jgi:hypothetical protein